MKVKALALICLLVSIMLLSMACGTKLFKLDNETLEINSEEGSFTNNNENDFTNAIPVKIDADILHVCYEYTDSWGYEIKDKKKYKSILLGKSHMQYVYVDDDSNRDLLDENDYLIIFDKIRIVIDADTGIALGHIPYV